MAAGQGCPSGPGAWAPLTRDGRHTLSPSDKVMKDLPPLTRETMLSTLAKKPYPPEPLSSNTADAGAAQ